MIDTDEPPQLCRNPVFVIGSPRSGTSILPWSLAHHSHFWTSRENELLFELLRDQHVQHAYDRAARPGAWLVEEGVDRSELLAHLGLGMNALFTSRSGGRRWVEQAPVNTLIGDELADMFPGALFLHIVRDGRQVVHSMIHFADTLGRDLSDARQLPEWAAGVEQAARTWHEFVAYAEGLAARRPGRVLTVANERLATDPEGEFRRIFAFLDSPYQEAPAEFFRTSRINSSFEPLVVWGAADGAPSPARAPERPAAWTSWSDEQRHAFTAHAGATLVRLGYARETDLAA